MKKQDRNAYIEKAKKAIENQNLQNALSSFQDTIGPATAAMYDSLPEGPGLRDKAHEIRMRVLENLDILLEKLADKIAKNGGHVYFAVDGESAVNYCLEVAQKHKVRSVVKGKSMVTEEIGLNDALIKAGIEVSETDLGEFIIQLANEKPTHILAPAIHKTRDEVASLFVAKLGIPYNNDPSYLARAARKELRIKFFRADMGITGCNQACAETGHITTLENEGNIRMATTLPKVHIAFMGMERICATLDEQDIILRLLCRGVAAQKWATYTSYIGGPRSKDQSDGPDEFHLVILDNGRSKILADPELREILGCIRCGACLNVCPVYRKIGGWSYGHTYCGPIGAVLAPLFTGINNGKDLILGETLCGACKDACPVHLDIPKLLIRLRTKLAEGDAAWSVRIANKK
jgi:L-lactate dehydrogenase complex protein LldF